ncbi:MAG: hypothetical protein AB7P37_14545 [Ramlibacter sp.]
MQTVPFEGTPRAQALPVAQHIAQPLQGPPSGQAPGGPRLPPGGLHAPPGTLVFAQQTPLPQTLLPQVRLSIIDTTPAPSESEAALHALDNALLDWAGSSELTPCSIQSHMNISNAIHSATFSTGRLDLSRLQGNPELPRMPAPVWAALRRCFAAAGQDWVTLTLPASCLADGPATQGMVRGLNQLTRVSLEVTLPANGNGTVDLSGLTHEAPPYITVNLLPYTRPTVLTVPAGATVRGHDPQKAVIVRGDGEPERPLAPIGRSQSSSSSQVCTPSLSSSTVVPPRIDPLRPLPRHKPFVSDTKIDRQPDDLKAPMRWPDGPVAPQVPPHGVTPRQPDPPVADPLPTGSGPQRRRVKVHGTAAGKRAQRKKGANLRDVLTHLAGLPEGRHPLGTVRKSLSMPETSAREAVNEGAKQGLLRRTTKGTWVYVKLTPKGRQQAERRRRSVTGLPTSAFQTVSVQAPAGGAGGAVPHGDGVRGELSSSDTKNPRDLDAYSVVPPASDLPDDDELLSALRSLPDEYFTLNTSGIPLTPVAQPHGVAPRQPDPPVADPLPTGSGPQRRRVKVHGTAAGKRAQRKKGANLRDVLTHLAGLPEGRHPLGTVRKSLSMPETSAREAVNEGAKQGLLRRTTKGTWVYVKLTPKGRQQAERRRRSVTGLPTSAFQTVSVQAPTGGAGGAVPHGDGVRGELSPSDTKSPRDLDVYSGMPPADDLADDPDTGAPQPPVFALDASGSTLTLGAHVLALDAAQVAMLSLLQGGEPATFIDLAAAVNQATGHGIQTFGVFDLVRALNAHCSAALAGADLVTVNTGLAGYRLNPMIGAAGRGTRQDDRAGEALMGHDALDGLPLTPYMLGQTPKPLQSPAPWEVEPASLVELETPVTPLDLPLVPYSPLPEASPSMFAPGEIPTGRPNKRQNALKSGGAQKRQKASAQRTWQQDWVDNLRARDGMTKAESLEALPKHRKGKNILGVAVKEVNRKLLHGTGQVVRWNETRQRYLVVPVIRKPVGPSGQAEAPHLRAGMQRRVPSLLAHMHALGKDKWHSLQDLKSWGLAQGWLESTTMSNLSKMLTWAFAKGQVAQDGGNGSNRRYRWIDPEAPSSRDGSSPIGRLPGGPTLDMNVSIGRPGPLD